MKLVLAIALAALSFAAAADPPDACAIISLAEVNAIAGSAATKVAPVKTGNPSECQWVNDKHAAVLVVSLRQVQYAAENELQGDRENLEKIYRGKVKWLDGIGDRAFWMPVNKQLEFRKGKIIISVKFSREKNQTEVDSAQVARLIDARVK